MRLAPATRTDLGAIELREARWVVLSGFVRTQEAAPIANAHLRISDARVRTGADGAFRFERVAPGPTHALVDARGMNRVFQLDVPDAAEYEVVLELTLGTRVLGGEVRSGGRPLPFVRLNCGVPDEPLARRWTRTDARGRFRFDSLTTDHVDMVVSNGRQRIVCKGLATGRDDHVLEIPPLPEPILLTGSVRSVDGHAIAGAMVLCPYGAKRAERTRSRPDGSYDLSLIVLERSVRVQVTADGHYPTQADIDVQCPPGAAVRHDISLVPRYPAGTVHGTVRTAGGEPVAGADCTVSGILQNGNVHSEHCRTDDVGVFSLDGVLAGDWTLRIAHARHEPFERPIRIEAGAVARVDVELPAIDRGDVIVTVRRPDGQPVRHAFVYVARRPFTGGGFGHGRTTADGRVTVPAVPAGPAAVIVDEVATGVSCVVDFEVPTSGAVEVAVVIPSGEHRIEGRVLRADGTPVRHGGVLIEGRDHAGAAVWHSVFLRDDGSFSCEGLPAGRYAVSRFRGVGDPKPIEVTVPGPPVELRLR